MQLQFTLVEDDIRDVQRAVAGAKPRGKRTEWRSFVDTRVRRRREVILGSILFPGLLVLLVVLSKDHVLRYFRENPRSVPEVGAYVFVGVVCLIFYLVKAPAIRRAAAARNPLLRGSITVTLSEATLVADDGEMATKYQQHAFSQLVESPSLFVLYMPSDRFVVIPKRALPDERGADQIRRWFQAGITSRMSYMDFIKSARLVPNVELIRAGGDPDCPGTVLEVCDRDDRELFHVVMGPGGDVQVLFFAHDAHYRLPLDVLERIVAVAKENVHKVDLD